MIRRDLGEAPGVLSPNGGGIERGLDVVAIETADRLARPTGAGERIGVDRPTLELQRGEHAVDLDRLAEFRAGHARAAGTFEPVLRQVVAVVAERERERDDEDEQYDDGADEPVPPAKARSFFRRGRWGFVGMLERFVEREVTGGGAEENPRGNPDPDQFAHARGERDGSAEQQPNAELGLDPIGRIAVHPAALHGHGDAAGDDDEEADAVEDGGGARRWRCSGPSPTAAAKTIPPRLRKTSMIPVRWQSLMRK